MYSPFVMSSGVETSLTIFHERRAQNFGTARDDDGHRTPPSFGVSCPSLLSCRAESRHLLLFSMNEERKTLEQRATMTDIERLRHSASHVLATAILKIWPEAQFAAGPPVENGFYYDVDLPHRISPDDFEKIEAEMKKEIKA